ADCKLAVAEIEHQAGADWSADDAFHRGARRREVAHDRFVSMIVMNHAHPSEYRAALGSMDFRSARLDFHLPAVHALEDRVVRNSLRVDPALDVPGALLADQIELVEGLDAFDRGLHAEGLAETDDRGDDFGAVLVSPGAGVDEALVD